MSLSPQPAREGRIVHVVAEGVNHCQPAIVVRSWGDGRGALNLQVFRDGSNDHEPIQYLVPSPDAPTRWATSVEYHGFDEDGAPGQAWHWPTEHSA